MMMLENLDNIQEESSYKRKEEAYNKHLQRLQTHLLKAALQSEAKQQQKFESEPLKPTAPCVQWHQLIN